MATIGLRDLYIAPITQDKDGKVAYGEPTRLAKAIQAQLAVTVAEATLYADDAVDAKVKEFVSALLTLGINDLEPQKQALILGQTMDDDGVVFAGEDDEPPHFAVGFRARKTGGLYRYVWFYDAMFGIPNEDYNTKGESITFNTPSIVGTIIKRWDGLWKADYVGKPDDPIAKVWFKTVREPNTATPTEPPTEP
ncbi:MAG: phage tail protein [Defluviitaleaceae bacterium]|nr:phage tail protein [Defluviitaleaceae bacterium]